MPNAVTHNPLAWIGLAGVSTDDNARARDWERRLRWPMVAVALLALPAYLLAASQAFPALQRFAVVLDALIFVAFLVETVWMAHLSSRPALYLAENWLNVAILAASAASLLGASSQWVVLARLARITTGGMVLLRTFGHFRPLLARGGAPKLVGFTVLVFALSGALLYWFEPTITSYWDGVWLAFATATTIGYGDFVATTPAARVVAVFVSLLGFGIVALFTANVVAYFIGRDVPDAQRQLRADIAQLRDDIAKLRDRQPPAADIDALRRELAELSARLSALASHLAARETNSVERQR